MLTDSQKLDRILSLLESRPAAATPEKQRPFESGGKVGDAALLDGTYGNPAVFKTEPNEWTGPSQVGVKASEVPTSYAELYASMMDRFGDKAKRENQLDKNGKATYWRKYQEAACFRGWAKRNADKRPDADIEF